MRFRRSWCRVPGWRACVGTFQGEDNAGLGVWIVHEGFDESVNLIELCLDLGEAQELNFELLPKRAELVLDHGQHIRPAHLRSGRTCWPSRPLHALRADLPSCAPRSASAFRAAFALRIKSHTRGSLPEPAKVAG